MVSEGRLDAQRFLHSSPLLPIFGCLCRDLVSCDGELDVVVDGGLDLDLGSSDDDQGVGLLFGSFDDVLVVVDKVPHLDLLEVRVFVMAPSLASCAGKTSGDPFHKKIKQNLKVNYLFPGIFYFSLVNRFSTRW